MSDFPSTTHGPLFIEHAQDLSQALTFARTSHAHFMTLLALSTRDPSDLVLHTDVGRAQGRAARAWRIARRPRQALDANVGAQAIWSGMGRPKASFLLELQHVQLDLQLGLRVDAHARALALHRQVLEQEGLRPYIAFADETLGCAQGALGMRAQARASFERLLGHRTTKRARLEVARRLMALCE